MAELGDRMTVEGESKEAQQEMKMKRIRAVFMIGALRVGESARATTEAAQAVVGFIDAILGSATGGNSE